MATYTENYKLKKPAADDFIDISDFNGNADIIDTQIKSAANTAKTVAEALPSKADLTDGVVPISQLPNSVKNKIEFGFALNGTFYSDAAHTSIIAPDLTKLYVDKAQNLVFRWTGTAYVPLSPQTAADITFNGTGVGLAGSSVSDALGALAQRALPITLIVHTNPGTVVTASKGATVLSATADTTGLAVLTPTGFGTWTLQATINSKIISMPYKIESVAIYDAVLTDSLESASWALISAISESGAASSYWSLGDTKTISLDGVSYMAKIIDFNHDTKPTGGKAGLTFQLKDGLAQKYSMNVAPENYSTNRGYWASCEMRGRMTDFLLQMPPDLQGVIKPVNKVVFDGSTTTSGIVIDKLFVLSVSEIFGSATNTYLSEGTQYAYYAAGNTKVKKVGNSESAWWTRSLRNSSSGYFCQVNASGAIDVGSSYNPSGVSFAFCV